MIAMAIVSFVIAVFALSSEARSVSIATVTMAPVGSETGIGVVPLEVPREFLASGLSPCAIEDLHEIEEAILPLGDIGVGSALYRAKHDPNICVAFH